ncbi:hypothetical protein GN956_G26128 [Arapaima gigas]
MEQDFLLWPFSFNLTKQEELSDVTDVKNPDATTATDRRQGRLSAESAKFDPDHYLADLFEDDVIQNLLKFHPWWTKFNQAQAQQSETSRHGVLALFFVYSLLTSLL